MDLCSFSALPHRKPAPLGKWTVPALGSGRRTMACHRLALLATALTKCTIKVLRPIPPWAAGSSSRRIHSVLTLPTWRQHQIHSHRKMGAHSHRTAPLPPSPAHTSDASYRFRSPSYLQLLSNLATSQRFLRPPPSLDSVNLLERLPEFRETVLTLAGLL